MSLPEVEIYTDGACSGNPGPGGWACILNFKGIEKELSGYASLTTNNRMELQAVIAGLEALTRPCRVNLYSDSAYVVNAFNCGWITKWHEANWLDKGTPRVNHDLWQRLFNLTKQHQVEWCKVKGHADDEKNNRCDALARQAIKEQQVNHRG